MIRHARPDEAGAVRDVVLSAYEPYVAVIGAKPGPMLDDYTTRIAANQVWVLQDADTIAGILVLENQPDCFLLDNIAIRPDQQGSGFGRKLLDFAETEATRHGHNAITLYTNALMTDNIAIYTARGYVEQARRIEKGFDRVYMQKPLVQPLSGQRT
ncbi:MAG TPA: GNAT family N-acetyltransferase [Rhodopila sp.]|jgi:GNAT superfamily N-acetyltransferase